MISRNCILNPILLFIIFLGIASCEDGAVVQPVTDPKEIRPEINLNLITNNQTGAVSSRILARLENRNGKAVEIDGGIVKVNGYPMTSPSGNYITTHDEYIINGDIFPDEVYTFEIIFSDGETYCAWIEAPDINLISMELPERVERGKKLSLKWQEKDYRYPQYLFIQYYDSDDGFSSSDQEKLQIKYPYLGTFEISKKYIQYTNTAEDVVRETRIMLRAETVGVLDHQFLSGGSIICRFILYQDIEVY